MSECTQDLLEVEINAEKCKGCQNIVSLEQLDENYQGTVATYGDDHCCTLECMGDAKKLAE